LKVICYITLHNQFEYFQIWSWIGPKFVFYSTMVTLGVGHYTMNGPYYDNRSRKFIDWVDVPCSNNWTRNYLGGLDQDVKGYTQGWCQERC
jgi:hypothetical protein